MGHTYITLGTFPFSFWGLHRYHILRLFRLKKRLKLPTAFSLSAPTYTQKTAPTYAQKTARLNFQTPVQWEVNSSSPNQITNYLASPFKAVQVLVPVLGTFWEILSHCCIYLSDPGAPPTRPQSLSLPHTARSAHLCFCSKSLCLPVDTNYDFSH